LVSAVNIGLPTGVQAPTDLHHHHPHPHHPQQQQQPQQQLLQRGWHGAPPDSGVDEEVSRLSCFPNSSPHTVT